MTVGYKQHRSQWVNEHLIFTMHFYMLRSILSKSVYLDQLTLISEQFYLNQEFSKAMTSISSIHKLIFILFKLRFK